MAVPAIVGHDVELRLGNAQLAGVALGVVMTGSLYGALGVAIGSITRNVAVSAIGAIAWFIVAENVIGSMISWRLARFLPGQAAAAAAGSGTDQLLNMTNGTALFMCYSLVLMAIAARLATHRDVT